MARWTNWAGDQACEPASIERPGTLDALRKTVAWGAGRGHRVRASASGHSFTDCALTEGTMIRLDGLGRKLDFDRSSGLFKVEAGAVLYDLNRMLDADGVAFSNLGDIDRQTVAGSISTGTHGTGERFQNVSAQVAALELVAPDGSLVTIDESEPDLLSAARVAIGSLGVVYSVTVHTVPAYTINRVDSPKPFDEVLESLDELNAGTDHFEFYVFPGSEVALCRESRRTQEAPAPKNPAVVYAQEVMLENWVGKAFAAAVRARPEIAPTLARLATKGLGRSTKVDASYKVFASERHIKFTEMEYAVPRERGRELIEGVLEIAALPELHVAWPIEVRFVKGDDSLLSPSHEQDTCYVAVHQDRRLAWEPYFRRVEALARSLDGRPHWGKRHFRTAADLAPAYPRWEGFQAARKRMDPDGVFANAYTDRVLGANA
ncbi:MAG: FAD-binding protein [Actinomycetota bacterium]|nr:FAD-binding protein [Actinomycetota bacterium]